MCFWKDDATCSLSRLVAPACQMSWPLGRMLQLPIHDTASSATKDQANECTPGTVGRQVRRRLVSGGSARFVLLFMLQQIKANMVVFSQVCNVEKVDSFHYLCPDRKKLEVMIATEVLARVTARL